MPLGTIADIPADRFERLERAILGDPDVGHLGAIERLNKMDAEHGLIPAIHEAMREERTAGDRRIHERLDAHAAEVAENRAQDRELARAHSEAIEKKIDRLWWMLIGSTAAGFVGGWAASGAPVPTP
jgi:hypothetical protein